MSQLLIVKKEGLWWKPFNATSEDVLNDFPDGSTAKISILKGTRSDRQNAKMWAMLGDISRQVKWPDSQGKEEFRSAETWKHIFSANLDGQRVMRGISGELVVMGKETHLKPSKWFSELFELIYAFGSEHEVKWSEKYPFEEGE